MHVRKTEVILLLLTSIVAMAQTAVLDPSSSAVVAAKSTVQPWLDFPCVPGFGQNNPQAQEMWVEVWLILSQTATRQI